MQLLNFRWKNSSTTSTKYFYMAATIFIKKVFHVFKKLCVSSLVTCYSNPVCIFFYSTFYYVGNAPVVAQVNNFCAFTLEDTPHNIYSCIMPVKQSCGSNNSY